MANLNTIPEPNAPRPANPFLANSNAVSEPSAPRPPNPFMGMLGGGKGGGTAVAPTATPTATAGQLQPTDGSLGFGKGGGAVVTPELTERGTYFNESGVEMMPRNGLGGANAIPYTEFQANQSSGVDSSVADRANTLGPGLQQVPQQPQFNVNQAAAGSLQGAIGATQQAMQGPLNVGAYANPFTSAVIDRTQQDIARQQEMATNTLGAQATAANAFGGSRHGVAEGVMAGEYGRMAGDIAAQQRQQNYSQALQAAMSDRQARLGAASQLGGLGQQAFQTGQTIQQQQQQAGLLQQGIQQALIDAAKQQYAGYTGAPQQALQAPLAALGVTPTPQTTTNSMQPGLFNYLQLGAGILG